MILFSSRKYSVSLSIALLEDLDTEPTPGELSEALDSLTSGKAPAEDRIPAEILKWCKGTLLTELHEILCRCWGEGDVPQNLKDANIVTLYKTNGNMSDCNDYRGISLLGIVGKIFARVAMKRLQALADSTQNLIADSDPMVSTPDMVFFGQLQEKCRNKDSHLS